jgi:hypothetical protein
MAVTAEKSAQFTDYSASPPKMIPASTWHGRVRASYFKFTQGVAAGDINSTADLVHLPAGRVRVLGQPSIVYFDAFGVARTLDVGYRAHKDINGAAVVEDEDAFISAADVSGAGSARFDEAGAAARALVLESQSGVDIFAKVEGGTIPAGTVLEGYVVYELD